jgi:uncharacterized repeat protein (TIGR01451 family)
MRGRGVFAVLLLLSLLVLPPADTRAEGSSNLTPPGVGSRPFLEYRTGGPSGTTNGIPRQTLIYVYANEGETINLGSSAVGRGQGRIIYTNPAGTRTTCPFNVGLIANRDQERGGPLPNATGVGYTPCVVTVGPGQAGVWQVDFVSPNPLSATDPTPVAGDAVWTQPTTVSYVAAWDVTVRAGAATRPGRVFANYLALNMGGNTIPGRTVELSSEVYILTKDGFEYRIDLNGIDPFGFIFFANNKGFRDDTTPNKDRIFRSIQLVGTNTGQVLPAGYSVHPPTTTNVQEEAAGNADITHKIFFDDPDPTLPATAPSPNGTVWLKVPPQFPPEPQGLTFVGKEGTPDQAGTQLGGTFTFTATALGTYRIIIELSKGGTTGLDDRVLDGSINALGTITTEWDGLDGRGRVVPASDLSFQARVVQNAGEVHFPFIDPENNPNGLVIERVDPPANTANVEDNVFRVFYDDSYNYTGGGAAEYDYSLCSTGNAPPPPAVTPAITPPTCYGTPPALRPDGTGGADGRAGVSSDPARPGANGVGAREFTALGGDRRGIDTWVNVSSRAVLLGTQFQIKEADLSITKRHLEPQPTIGGPLTYQLDITNNGPSNVVGATISDTIPADVTVSAWSCAITTGTGRCATPSGTGNVINTTVDLDRLSVATFTISGTVAQNASCVITNTATISRPLDVNEPNTNNNSASDTATVCSALVSTKVATLLDDTNADGRAEPGERLAYTIAVTNTGTTAVAGATFSDTIPANTTYVPGSTTLNGAPVPDLPGGVMPFSNGAAVNSPGAPAGQIGADGVATIAFRVTINNPLPIGVTAVSNQGVTNVPNTPPVCTDDPLLPGRCDPTVTPVGGPSVLQIGKTDNNQSVAPGGTVVYTVTYTNTGNRDATNLVVQETVPLNTMFDAQRSSAGWSCANGAVAGTTCLRSVPLLAANGGSGSALFAVDVNNPLPPNTTELENIVTIRRSDSPPTRDDPRGRDTTPVLTPTLVTLLRFNAVRTPDGVLVRWTTTLEQGTEGFMLLRSIDGDRRNAVRVTSSVIPARGPSGGSYSFQDRTALPGERYTYWLVEVLQSTEGNRTREYGPATLVAGTTDGQRAVFLPLTTR